MSQFNTRNYEWSRVQVQIDDRVMVGIRGVAYKRTRELEYLYGAGDEPADIMDGNVAYEGSVTLLQDELERLIDRAPGGHLDNLEVTIVVAYRKPGGALVTNTMTGVRFQEMGKELKQNDKHMETTLPILFTGLRLR